MTIKSIVVGALIFIGSGAGDQVGGYAWAAIDQKLPAPNRKMHKYIEEGIYMGGESAAMAHALTNVKRIYSPKDKIERLLFELGDEKGQPLLKRSSYFQVSVQKNPARIVIDLAQMAASGVDDKKLLSMLQTSPYIKNAKIKFDPVDGSICVQLDLKQNIDLEVFQILTENKASRIAIDIKAKGQKL